MRKSGWLACARKTYALVFFLYLAPLYASCGLDNWFSEQVAHLHTQFHLHASPIQRAALERFLELIASNKTLEEIPTKNDELIKAYATLCSHIVDFPHYTACVEHTKTLLTLRLASDALHHYLQQHLQIVSVLKDSLAYWKSESSTARTKHRISCLKKLINTHLIELGKAALLDGQLKHFLETGTQIKWCESVEKMISSMQETSYSVMYGRFYQLNRKLEARRKNYLARLNKQSLLSPPWMWRHRYKVVGGAAVVSFLYSWFSQHAPQLRFYGQRFAQKFHDAIIQQLHGLKAALDNKPEDIVKSLDDQSRMLEEQKAQWKVEHERLIEKIVQCINDDLKSSGKPLLSDLAQQELREELKKNNFEILVKNYREKVEGKNVLTIVWNSTKIGAIISLLGQAYKHEGVRRFNELYGHGLEGGKRIAGALASSKFSLATMTALPMYAIAGISFFIGKKSIEWISRSYNLHEIVADADYLEEMLILDSPSLAYQGAIIYCAMTMHERALHLPSLPRKRLEKYCRYLVDPSLTSKQKRRFLKKIKELCGRGF